MPEVNPPRKTVFSRRGRGQGVGLSIQKILAPLATRQGFRTATIITHWAEIVGSHYAPITTPLKVTYIPRGEKEDGTPMFEATLHVMVKNTSMALTMKYVEPQILERLNSHFGYAAVQKMKLHHGRAPDPNSAPSKPRTGPTTPFPEERLDDISEEPLKAALRELGAGVWQDGGRP